MKTTNDCPLNLTDRLSSYFYGERRKSNLSYRCQFSSMGTDGCYYFFVNNNTLKSIVITTTNSKEDWKRINVEILTNDPVIEELIRPICSQYTKEMYDYYSESN